MADVIPGVPSGVVVPPASDAGEAGAGEAAHTKATARNIAALIAEQAADNTPNAIAQASAQLAKEANEKATADAAAAAAAGTATVVPGTDAGATVAEEVAAEAGVEPSEVEATLLELGVDLGIKRADVPVELQPAYDRLISVAADMAQASLQESLTASDMQRQYTAFAERINKEPDKLLLTLAVTKPEVFSKIAELFQTMQNDPAQKDLIIRELQAEARLREAERREAGLNEQNRKVKARQVIAATRNAARAEGVDFDIAEKFVALAVTANGGDLDVSEVAGLVKEIKSKTAPRPTPKVATPVQKPVQTAPNQPVAGAAAPATSVGLEPERGNPGRGGKMRSILSTVVKNLNAQAGKGAQ